MTVVRPGCCFRTARYDLVFYTVQVSRPVVVVPWGLVENYWVVGWLLVENCTVDASILFFVVKLSRANGGCLGTRSR